MLNSDILESRRVAFLLAMIGGVLELYSYLLKGKVFATAITGNIVLMIYKFKSLSITGIDIYIFPILSFCLGVTLVALINKKYHNEDTIAWKSFVIVLEIVTLLLIPHIESNKFATSLIAFASSIQIQTFRHIYGDVYMSTVCTGNTRSLIDNLINKKYDKAKNFAIALSGFFIGVVIGDIAIDYMDTRAVYICILPLLLVLYFINQQKILKSNKNLG